MEDIKLNEELLKDYEENLDNVEEGIQTTFNNDSLEDLNDSSVEIENIGAEEVEGIGATGFVMRTTKPVNNKNYMTTSTGGWSTCIKGSPCDPTATVLSNCVGYASARFNEVINECRGTTGCTYKTLNCNAENFPERAVAAGLKIGSTPRRGAIICWQKGSLSSGDGAGHVEYLERVNNSNSIYTSSSGWGSSNPFWNSTRSNSNGKWGIGSGYSFRCFIYLPDDVQKWVDGGSGGGVTPNVPRDEYKNQIEVLISDLRVRNGAGTDKGIVGMASKGFYNYYETADASGYKWYRIADGQWIASKDGWTNVYPGKEPEPIKLKYKVGDKMVFNGVLYANAQGGGAGQSRKDFVCTITMTYDKPGTTKPYNINNGLGWVAEADLTPYVEPQPTPPTPTPTLNVGDKVKIIGTGKASSYGDNPTAGGIGWNRYILKIWNGRPYPYQVGANGSTTGFYKASALQKL